MRHRHLRVMIPLAFVVSAASARAQDVDCCDLANQRWIGPRPPAQCLARPGHVPATDPKASACDDGGGGGGGGGRDPKIDLIPNGGFEQWKKDKPDGFGSYSTPAGSKVKIETVFRSSDAHSGQSSVLIRNAKIKVPGVPKDFVLPLMPGGLVSCKADCPVNTGRPLAGQELESTTFPITRVDDYFCGYYKATLVGGDVAALNLLIRSGKVDVGGVGGVSAPGAIGASANVPFVTESSSKWTFFKLPVVRIPGQENAIADNGIVQVVIIPSAGVTNPMGIHDGSEIKLDDVGFCGSEVDLQITNAKAIGGEIVPDSKEEDIGAQTFVNLDNDDGDGAFDRDDADPEGVKGGDDELVQLLLELPEHARGEAVLTLSGPDKAVKIWQSESKTPGSEFKQLGQVMKVPGDFNHAAGVVQKVLWVEALAPTEDKPITFELTFTPVIAGNPTHHQTGQPQTDKVKLTTLGIKRMTWKGKGNGEDPSARDTLKVDPNFPAVIGKAVRVFPGRQPKADFSLTDNLDKVGLEVELTSAPTTPIDVWFRSFDVDDPTAQAAPIDDESQPGDNRGTTIDPAGVFTDSKSPLVKVEFKGAIETVELQVTMQPGDNFRVVGSCDRDFLERLDNDDTKLGTAARDLQRVVDPDVLTAVGGVFADGEVRESASYVSDTLTVWRYFYTEIDRMGAVKGLRVSGTIQGATQSHTDDGDVTILEIDKNLSQIHPTDKKTAGVRDSYRDGALEIGGVPFVITENSARGSGHDTVTVKGHWDPKKVKGLAYSVRDDDARAQWDDGSPIPAPDVSRLGPAFEPAFVVPVHDALRNGPRVPPFLLNTAKDDAAYLHSLFGAFDNVKYDDTKTIWVVYVLVAYQAMKTEDGDGRTFGLLGGATFESATSGEAAGKWGALLYAEGGRELEAEHAGKADLLGKRVADSAPHEIGHLFCVTHGMGGLIDQDGQDFSPASLVAIRGCPNP